MIISIAICDDEEIHRKNLCHYLSLVLKNKSYKVLEFCSGEDLIENYPSSIDILLLDVQMTGINGLDTAREIRKFDTNVNIIFTTAIIDFIQQGYEVKAFRYLLKPINYDEFSRNLLECINEIEESNENYLTIKENDSSEIIRVPINNILYVETYSRHILIHTDTKTYKTRESINNIEEYLGNIYFYRCHRSYLININKVKSIKQNSVIIKEDEILVSRYKMKGLKLKITNELGKTLC